MLSKKEKYGVWVFALCFFIAIVWSVREKGPRPRSGVVRNPLRQEGKEEEKKPNDWFFMQRAYPLGHIPVGQYLKSLEQAQRMRATAAGEDGVVWQQAGPTNIPGRITDLAVHPDYPDIIYAGAACGGVFKSIDSGISWTPIFDEQGSPSIGAMAIHPNDPQVLYVGTGEANGSGDSYPGTGIYKSTDAGASWTHIGLEESYHIGRIVIHPLCPETVFVAACGKLFGTNPERGIYKSTNGGTTWERKLFISDSTAAIDVAVDPTDPQIVYAAMWERVRYPAVRKVGGWTSGIHKSTDGGETWHQLANGLPPSGPNVGRIGLSVCASSPNVIYAMYCDHPGDFMGLFKSADYGQTWTRTNDSVLEGVFGGFAWYFGNVRVDPANPDIVFAMAIYLYRSTDGGDSWTYVSSQAHVDHHAMFIHPVTPSRIYLGCDGGVYLSTNGGTAWSLCGSQPSTQFYAITIDHLYPERLYGGTQDNGTLRTLTGATDDWEMIHGADGFYTNVDFTNSDVIYAEYQWGHLRKSIDLGYSWIDMMDGINENDRRNWCTPVVMDPVDNMTLYYGTYRLYKTTNGGGVWIPISDDLTDGPGGANLSYGTITTIGPAPSNPLVVYAGTDDANLWVTTSSGASWTRIDSELPDRWVTRVAVDPYADSIAYVALSGHTVSGTLPHIYRTTNYGGSWQPISSNLPEAPINDLIVDPMNTSVLYAGSDVGVYVTENLGESWEPLGFGLPITAVHDLSLHEPTRKLVAGTHGRSMFSCQLPPTDTLYGIQVTGGERVYTVNAIDTDVTFLIENTGLVTDSVDITVSADWLGWNLIPETLQIALQSGQIDTALISVSVPYDAEMWSVESITLHATSGGNPYHVDQASREIQVTGKRGDADFDCDIDLGDVVFLLNYLFRNGEVPPRPETADADCDELIDIADAVVLLNYLFRDGPLPCAPE
jgi:photosystem II stability/assembly factor-like uncharacterized protein